MNRFVPCSALLLALLLAGPAAAQSEARLEAGPSLGAPAPDRAWIWAVPRDATDARVKVWPAAVSQSIMPLTEAPLITVEGGSGSAHALITGLEPDEAYRYEVWLDGEVRFRSMLRTAPAPGAKFRGVFGLASCMDTKRDRDQLAWKTLIQDEPRLLIHLGDNHYGNSPLREIQWEMFLAQRKVEAYAAVIQSTPTLAIWDDHDYGRNNGGGDLPKKEESLAVLSEVFPGPARGLPGSPGVFGKHTFGDVDIFLLDTRWYRSKNFSFPRKSKQMLGAAQEEWLFRELQASTATFKIVASGSTLAQNPRDGWFLYSHARARLFSTIANVPGVIALSGDIHWSQVTYHDLSKYGGYRLPEVTSSGIGIGKKRSSFAQIAFDTTLDDPTATVTVIEVDRDGDLRSKNEITIKRSQLEPAAASDAESAEED